MVLFNRIYTSICFLLLALCCSGTVGAWAQSPALTALAGHKQAYLSWTSSSGATGYAVSRGSSANNLSPLTTLSSSTFSYTDPNLTAGSTYYYRITANKSSGSVNSNTATATALQAPDVASTSTSNQITLSWPAAPGATRYDVYRGATYASATLMQANVTSRTYTNGSLTAGDKYTYYVKASNSTGYTYSTLDLLVSSPPVLVAGVGNGQIVLNWSAATGAARYDLFRGTDPNDYTTFIPLANDLSSSTLFYVDNTVTNGTPYTYALVASNGNNIVYSNTVTATATVPPVLSALAGNGQVNLNWTTVPGATGYLLFRGTNANDFSTFAPLTTFLSSSTLQYTDSEVNNGTSYSYAVVTNVGSDFIFSNIVTATPNIPVPLAPTGLAATPGDAQVNLTWNTIIGATSYSLKRSASQTGPFTVLPNGPFTSPHLDTTVINGETYYYVVSASNAAGEGPDSAAVQAIPVGPTATPTNTPTSTPTATPTNTPTATPTSTPTATPTSTPTATPTSTPTATPTSTPTATPTSTPTSTPTATPTNTPIPAAPQPPAVSPPPSSKYTKFKSQQGRS